MNEISTRSTQTASSLYFTIRNLARQMCVISGPTFETIVVAHWSTYKIAITEAVSGSYLYSNTATAFPAVANGWYWVDIYLGSGAINDPLVLSQFGFWNGTTFSIQAGDATSINGVVPTMGASLTFPASVASPTNITAASGISLAANQHVIVDSGTVTSVSGAVGSVTGAVGSVTGNVGGNVTGSVGSISGITFPSHFSSLAIDSSGLVTFNNTVITTVTNLTNAPTAGDLTATMKASVQTADAAVITAAGLAPVATATVTAATSSSSFTVSGLPTAWTGPIVGTSGVNLNRAGNITVNAAGVLTVTGLPATPGNGDTFAAVNFISQGGGGSGLDPQQTCDAVFKLAPSAGAPAAGSIGANLFTIEGLCSGVGSTAIGPFDGPCGPLVGVVVTMYTDSARTTPVQGIPNPCYTTVTSEGYVAFNLPSGTFYWKAVLAGWGTNTGTVVVP